MPKIIWGKRYGTWYGTIGEASFWWAKIEKENGKFYSEISHKTFSEGIISRDGMNHNTLEEAKASAEKRLLSVNASGDAY